MMSKREPFIPAMTRSGRGGLLSYALLFLIGMSAWLAPAASDSTSSKPCPIDADLWVLAGQSNMQGWGMLDHPVVLNPRRIMNFRMNNKWAEPTQPIHWNVEAANIVHKNILFRLGMTPEDYEKQRAAPRPEMKGGVDVGVAFAKHIIDNTDRNIGLIPCALGATYIEWWDPALKDEGDASLYGSMINRINMVGGNIKGILWYQGESDAYEHCAPKYEERLLNLVDAIRRDTGQPDLPFLYVQIARWNYPDQIYGKWWEAIREIQRHAASKRKNMYMISAVDTPLGDFIHISPEGQQMVGRRLAEVALTEVYHQPGHGRAIDLESIKVVSGNTTMPKLRLHFSGVTGRLKACGRPADFEVRSSEPPAKAPTCFRTELDPEDPAGVIVHIQGKLTPSTKLIYGSGMQPYMNIKDEKDIPVPAFGPIEIPLAEGD